MKNHVVRQFFFFFLVFPTLGYCASFDCNRAKTPVEIMICQDETLSKLDEQLSQSFRKAKSRVAEIGLFRFYKQTFAYLEQRNACADKACLLQWYADRQTSLIKLDRLPYYRLTSLTGTLNDVEEKNDQSAALEHAIHLDEVLMEDGIPDREMIGEEKKGTRIVRLDMSSELAKKYESLKGKKAKVSCLLFRPNTHTVDPDVWCDVRAITP